MYTLSADKKLAVISGLVEGNSIRSISRMTDVDRNTINSLLLRTGERCATLLDERMRQLPCRRLQCDEIWTYGPMLPRKSGMYARTILKSLAASGYTLRWTRITNLSPRGLSASDAARTLRHSCKTCGNVLRTIGFSSPQTHIFSTRRRLRNRSHERYSPSPILEVISRTISGVPDPAHVSTSYVERQNLTIRMQMRRFTRLANAFSKKLTNLKAACALHFAHYNFCRVHTTLRVTPAMAAGVCNEIWPLTALLG